MSHLEYIVSAIVSLVLFFLQQKFGSTNPTTDLFTSLVIGFIVYSLFHEYNKDERLKELASAIENNRGSDASEHQSLRDAIEENQQANQGETRKILALVDQITFVSPLANKTLQLNEKPGLIKELGNEAVRVYLDNFWVHPTASEISFAGQRASIEVYRRLWWHLIERQSEQTGVSSIDVFATHSNSIDLMVSNAEIGGFRGNELQDVQRQFVNAGGRVRRILIKSKDDTAPGIYDVYAQVATEMTFNSDQPNGGFMACGFLDRSVDDRNKYDFLTAKIKSNPITMEWHALGKAGFIEKSLVTMEEGNARERRASWNALSIGINGDIPLDPPAKEALDAANTNFVEKLRA